MSWIILALTLGASITSIIHGVFMLFGALTVSTAAIPGIPSTMLAVLPVVSAVFALIGGIIAFNLSKWGALFLFVATALCVPTRDTWLYGGIYFFAALLCFFLKARPNDDYDYMYDDYGEDMPEQEARDDGPDFYYAEDFVKQKPRFQPASPKVNIDTLEADITLKPNNEPPKLRRRMSKICPECGAIVSRDSHFCSSCGTKLYVAPEDEPEQLEEREPVLEDELLMPSAEIVQDIPESVPVQEQQAVNVNTNEDYGDEDMTSAQAIPNYRVQVRPRNIDTEPDEPYGGRMMNDNAEEAASSYQEFAKYSRRGKKRKRSAGRKVFSMLLLIAAVGGALYFLLGLRKLPPGDLPPMVRPELVQDSTRQQTQSRQQDTTQPRSAIEESIAEPVEVPVDENMLPNFTPERTPSTGLITGNGVNIRADHSTAATRVTRLSNNTRVEILDSFNVPSGQFAGIWWNIRTGSREGWVYGRYLQPIGSGIPQGYSNALLHSFGNTKSQLVEALGNPTRNTSSSAEWPGLTATLRGEDITRLRLTGSSRELQNGLKTGMSQTALLQIMGYPSSVSNRTWNYNEGNKTGLSVQLNGSNNITTITVNEIQ